MFTIATATSAVVGVSATLLIGAGAEYILTKIGKPELAKTLKIIINVGVTGYIFYNVFELVQFITMFRI
jgi:hypothetical protein